VSAGGVPQIHEKDKLKKKEKRCRKKEAGKRGLDAKRLNEEQLKRTTVFFQKRKGVQETRYKALRKLPGREKGVK